MASLNDEELGRRAVEKGLLSSLQLEEALREAKAAGCPLAHVLVRRRLLNTTQLSGLLSGPARLARDLADDVRPKLDRYEILERIGRGGMATVYRAVDRQLQRAVALKVIHDPSGMPEDLVRRFQREASAAARLSHPNIVQIHDVGMDADAAFIVMELVEGPSLAEVLSAHVAPREELLRILARVSRAAHAAHLKGVVHRDIKPGNILIDAAGEPKLADFGLAHLVDSESRLTRTGSAMGTPVYMAPEQVLGRAEQIGAHTDVYELGAILYEILTARPPHSGATLAEVYANITSTEPEPPRGVPADLVTICMRALAMFPADRYPSAEALADDLERFLRGDPILARPPTFLTKTLRYLRQQRPAVLIAGTVLGLALAAFAIFYRPDRSAESQRRAVEAVRGATEQIADARGLLSRADADLSQVDALLRKAVDESRRSRDLWPGYAPAFLSEAAALRLLRREAEAEQALDEAIRLEPGNARARLERGRVRLDRAIAATRFAGTGALAQRTERARAFLDGARDDLSRAGSLGGLSELEGKLAEVSRLFAEARMEDVILAASHEIEREGRNEAYYFLRGAAQAHRGRLKEGLGDLNEALRLWPHSLSALIWRGHVHSLLGVRAAAIADWTRALRLDPGLSEILLARAHEQFLGANFPAARADLDEAIRLDPAFAQAWLNRAGVRHAMGDSAGGLQDCAHAEKEDAALAAAVEITRGMIYAETGRPAEADASFTRSLQLDSSNAAAYRNRGRLRLERGQPDKALEDVEAAMKLAIDNADTRLLLANCLYRLDRLSEALTEASALIDSGRLALEARKLRAQVFLDQGKPSEAMEDLDAAMRLGADDAVLYYHRGLAFQGLGKIDEAIADYTRSVERDPKFARAWLNRGYLRLQKRDESGALADYDSAIDADPQYARAWLNRAIFFKNRMRWEEAARDYRKAFELDPAMKTRFGDDLRFVEENLKDD